MRDMGKASRMQVRGVRCGQGVRDMGETIGMQAG